MVVLHLAFLDGLAFGQDIVFTYGPWGFVATRIYVPGTFGWLLVWWIVLAASIWYAAFAVARAAIRSPLWAGVWLTALLLVVGLGYEAAFMAVAVLFVVVATGPLETRLLTGATTVLAALLAWLGLVKFTYLGLGVAVITLVTTWLLVTRRRVGPALPVYLVAWLFLWLAAGQPVGAIPNYLVNGLSVAAGYTPAMSLRPPDTWVVGMFLAAAGAILATAFVVERRKERRFTVLTVGLGVVLFLAFKAGFVRPDDGHVATALLALAVTAVVTSALPGLAMLGARVRGAARLALAGLAVLAWHVAALPGPVGRLDNLAHTADDTAVFFVGPSGAASSRRDGWKSALAQIRENVPLPRVRGTVDVYPDDQLVLVANRLQPFSRPVFQSYSAYTPRLIALNERQLRRPERPRTIFVDLAPIDGRWPTSEDGPNLMTIVADYRLRRSTSAYLMFEDARRAGYRLRRVGTVRSSLGAAIAVPPVVSGPIWVTVDVRRTLLGKLEELVFRPATLYLDAQLADGRRVRHRLVSGVAHDGFLLSPYLADRNALAAMTRPGWRRALAGSAVRSVVVRAYGDHLRGYADRVGISFSRVELRR